MFETLDVFRIADGLARNASARQAVVARNIAHADTPGYRAQDIASFAETFDAGTADTTLRATRPGHLGTERTDLAEGRLIDAPGPSSPNGNTVTIEREMVRASEIRQQHDMALSVYKSALNILRTSLGR